MMLPSEVCQMYQVQACHICDNLGCGDNTNPVKAKLDEAQEISKAALKKQIELQAKANDFDEAQDEAIQQAAIVGRLGEQVDSLQGKPERAQAKIRAVEEWANDPAMNWLDKPDPKELDAILDDNPLCKGCEDREADYGTDD
jgi:hypothetical protein